MKRITLDSIATELGISKYSVSRALSGKNGVSEKTREAVVEVARQLGYKHSAISLEKTISGSGNIVFLIPYRDVNDPEFWMDVMGGASDEADRLGYTFVMRPINSTHARHPSSLENVHGVIVAGSRAREVLQSSFDGKVHAVFVTYAQPLENVDTVHSADWEGGYAVAEYLISLGHTRLVYVTEAPEKPSFAARAKGFLEAAKNHDIAVNQINIDSGEPGLSFEGAFRKTLDRNEAATGILTSTDGIAYTVIWALTRLGLAVPADVSVVGHNDRTESAQFVPKLTTLRIATREIGMMAMRFLHERISQRDNGYTLPPRRLELAPTLVLRDSTAAPRTAGLTALKAERGPA